ncbi:MAG: CRISPR-associated endonuclease Cas1 [Lentisphaerae bacterium]|nr:CRISPR-associated endonuclease Cas1 [Lentisphaerota bacterium]
MASLILTSDILRVTRLSERLEIIRRVRDKDGERNETSHVPLFDIDRVIILGQPSITMPAITSLLDRGIPCFLLTARGRWRGTITPDNNLNAARRIRQYEQGTDPEFTLRIARVLVNAKIRNCRRVLQRLAANRNAASGPEYEHSVQALKEYAKMAEQAETAEIARGAEGIAAALYFQRMASYFPENMPFLKRTRRPPRDPANALLSFGYTVVMSEVEGVIRSHGLDAAIGCLHTDKTNTPSLALDLMEPFRPAIVDLLVLNIVNHLMVKPEGSFEYHDDGGVYLNEDGRRSFFLAYEQSMCRRFAVSKDSAHTNLRRVIDEQVCAYIRALEQDVPMECFLLP